MRRSVITLAAVGFLAPPLLAETTVEINGRAVKLETKPMTAYEDLSPAPWQFRNSALPQTANIVDLQTPVKNQSNRGSCAYFTATALVEHALKVFYEDNRDVNLSEEFMIFANKNLDGITSRGDGSFLSSNLGSLQRHGFMLEEQMPYTPSWFSNGLPCAEFEDDNTAPLFCRAHYAPTDESFDDRVTPDQFDLAINRLRGFDEVVAKIAAGSAVTISLPVNRNGWQTETVTHSAELEAECDEKPDLCGGHTVLLTGYNLEEEHFLFKNSWGNTWGNEGYGKLPFDFFYNWSYGRLFEAEISRLDRDLENKVFDFSVDNPKFTVNEYVLQDNIPGIQVDLSFDYQAPIGSYYYVSVFAERQIAPATADSEASYETISYLDPEAGLSYIAAREYRIAFSATDLSFASDSPMSLFIPFSDFAKAGIIDFTSENIFLRTTIYDMSDTQSFRPLFREYTPLNPEEENQDEDLEPTEPVEDNPVIEEEVVADAS